MQGSDAPEDIYPLNLKIRGVDEFNHGQLMPHHSKDTKVHEELVANLPGFVRDLFLWISMAVSISLFFAHKYPD